MTRDLTVPLTDAEINDVETAVTHECMPDRDAVLALIYEVRQLRRTPLGPYPPLYTDLGCDSSRIGVEPDDCMKIMMTPTDRLPNKELVRIDPDGKVIIHPDVTFEDLQNLDLISLRVIAGLANRAADMKEGKPEPTVRVAIKVNDTRDCMREVIQITGHEVKLFVDEPWLFADDELNKIHPKLAECYKLVEEIYLDLERKVDDN